MSKPFIRSLSRLILGALLAVSAGLVQAAAPINTLKPGLISDKPTGIAILGYDTVAYFTDNKAVAGSDQFKSQWMGATWKFASQAHLDLFKAEPAKYAPQYGGYCAYGVTRDYLVKIDPTQFTVLAGKLYLNYDADVQKKWSKDPQGYIASADRKFSDLLKK